MRAVLTSMLLALTFSLAFSVTAGASVSRLQADVAEWNIVPSIGVVAAGRVRLVVRNYGLLPHQVLVARSSRFAASLPVRGRRALVRPLGSPVLVQPGRTSAITVRLTPGSYLLLDNLPGHYTNGTWVAITVR